MFISLAVSQELLGCTTGKAFRLEKRKNINVKKVNLESAQRANLDRSDQDSFEEDRRTKSVKPPTPPAFVTGRDVVGTKNTATYRYIAAYTHVHMYMH